MGLGAPGNVVNQKKEPSGAPFVAASANNGLSVDPVTGKIVLGNAAGGTAAILLNAREIPFGNTGQLLFTDPFNNETVFVPGTIFMTDGLSGATINISSTTVLMQNAAVTASLTSEAGNVQIVTDSSAGAGDPFLVLNNSQAGGAATILVHTSTLQIGNAVTSHILYFDMSTGRLGVDVPIPTARVHIAAGVAAASGAPFKYIAGVLAQTVVENGAKNFDGTNESLAVGGVTYTMAKTLTATAALDFPLTATLNSSDLTIALTGAALGDVVLLGVPNVSTLTNSCYTAWVSAANTVTVRFNNYSVAGQDPASGTFRISIVKY